MLYLKTVGLLSSVNFHFNDDMIPRAVNAGVKRKRWDTDKKNMQVAIRMQKYRNVVYLERPPHIH